MSEDGLVKPIVVGGTFESWPGDPRTTPPLGSMLSGVTGRLDRKTFDVARWVGYPASYGGNLSFERSVAEGIDQLDRAVRSELSKGPKKQVALLGYSQGAVVIRQWLLKKYSDVNTLAAVGLIADPAREPNQVSNLGVNENLSGILELGRIPLSMAKKWYSMANPLDPITSLPPGSLLRLIPDFTQFFSTNPAFFDDWMRENIETIMSREWQLRNVPRGQPWRVSQAIEAAGRYLPREMKIFGRDVIVNPTGGQHTNYGSANSPHTNVTYTQLLAEKLNLEVEGRMKEL